MKKINLDVIKDYYYATNDGKIISLFDKNNPVELKFDTDKDGYFRTSLQCKDGKRRSYRVSRLIGITFVDNPNNYPVINHIDCNKQNNHHTNLEWTTVSYNTQHAYDNNLINHGRIRKVKATNIVTKEVIEFDSLKECMKHYSIDVSCLSKMCSGKMNPYKKGKIANINFEYA